MSALQDLVELACEESFNLHFGWSDLNKQWLFSLRREGALGVEGYGDSPELAAHAAKHRALEWLGAVESARNAKIDAVIARLQAHLDINTDLEAALVLLRELRER